MRHAPLAALLLSAAPAAAELRVLADTAPVHSLVAQVMGDLGEPELIVAPGTSPHDASLSPSEARALSEAEVIVWTGPALLPWLGEAMDSLAPGAPRLTLLETGGWEPLGQREGATAGAQGGDGGEPDPHAWLDPAVGAAWLGHISEALAAADPANGDAYRANAAAAAAEALRLGEELRARLSPLGGTGLAVGHDAYRYLERAAGLPAAWAIADAGGSDPAPAAAARLREAVLAGEVGCLLLDAETDAGWAATLGEGAALRTATVDPDGVSLEPGPALYGEVIEGLATALEGCLAP